MSVLWTSADAAEATGGQATQPWQATGVSIDTRSLEPGDLFVALTDVRDGHDFVADALAKGAAAALVSRIPDGVAQDAPLLIVDDVLGALGDLGRAGRARMQGHVIGVTGSVGKTTTKEMLRVALSAFGHVHAAEKSFNNHWGVPLTLARMPATADFAVIEIGMNHPGEIAPLAQMAQPHLAVVTTVAPAHLEAFDSVDAIAREKATIFDGLAPGGTAIFHGDLEVSPILQRHALETGAGVLRFGAGQDDDIALRGTTMEGTGMEVEAHVPRGPLAFILTAPGRHLAENALAVLAVAVALRLDTRLAANALAGWSPVAGRGTRTKVHLDDGPLYLIDDAFNANPASMRAALDVLATTTPGRGGRRVAILGDMLELGQGEVALHAALAQLPAMKSVDKVHAVGPLMKHLFNSLPFQKRGQWIESAPEAVEVVSELARAGDVVLVKGSKSSRVSMLVDAFRDLGHSAPPDAKTG